MVRYGNKSATKVQQKLHIRKKMNNFFCFTAIHRVYERAESIVEKKNNFWLIFV